MPVASCVLAPELALVGRAEDLLLAWSNQAGVDQSLLTLDICRAEQRLGKSYLIITTLFLPSAWSPSQVNTIQLALAKTLAIYFQIELSDVLVITQVIQSGLVVEHGQLVVWK